MAYTCVTNITCNLLEMCREANIARYIVVRRRVDLGTSIDGCEYIIFVLVDGLVGRPVVEGIFRAIGGRCCCAVCLSNGKRFRAARVLHGNLDRLVLLANRPMPVGCVGNLSRLALEVCGKGNV